MRSSYNDVFGGICGARERGVYITLVPVREDNDLITIYHLSPLAVTKEDQSRGTDGYMYVLEPRAAKGSPQKTKTADITPPHTLTPQPPPAAAAHKTRKHTSATTRGPFGCRA